MITPKTTLKNNSAKVDPKKNIKADKSNPRSSLLSISNLWGKFQSSRVLGCQNQLKDYRQTSDRKGNRRKTLTATVRRMIDLQQWQLNFLDNVLSNS